jgi:hypothetical protein
MNGNTHNIHCAICKNRSTLTACLPKIHSDPILPSLSSGLFPSVFPNKPLYNFLSSAVRATCPTNFILLDVISLMIFRNEY